MEHHSNIVPWHFLREQKGAVLKWVPVLEDGSFDLDAFEGMVTDRTKIVALDTHVQRARHGHADPCGSRSSGRSTR
jgi:cysteine desulfurase/selenocysteine lyase